MELREYAQILIRRWWIPAVLVVLTGLFSAVQLRPWVTPPPTYTASLRLLLGVDPIAQADVTTYDPRYYAWLTSEYLVDDFTQVVNSQLFASNVSQRLADQDIVLPAGVIRGASNTGQQHRIITLSLSWGDRAQIEAMANAAADELTENAAFYFKQLGTEQAVVTLLDAPSIGQVGTSLRSQLELPLRLGLALILGIGLIFLLDYLDTSIRTRRDLDDLGLAVIGEIPKK